MDGKRLVLQLKQEKWSDRKGEEDGGREKWTNKREREKNRKSKRERGEMEHSVLIETEKRGETE